MSSEVFLSPARSLTGAWQGNAARTSSDAAQDAARSPQAKPGAPSGRPAAGAEGREAGRLQAGNEDSARLDPEQLNDAVEELNGLVQSIRRELRFSVDEESGRSVISVIDSETEEVIRQIPPEQVVKLVQHFRESEGSLFEERA